MYGGPLMHSDDGATDFDYVIVGAGSAGCVLANRLSADGKHSVLLLEAGPKDSNLWIHVPLGYGRLFKEKSVNWMYQTEPEPGLGGRRCSSRVAKCWADRVRSTVCFTFAASMRITIAGASAAIWAGAMTTCCRISRKPRTSSAAPTISMAPTARCRSRI